MLIMLTQNAALHFIQQRLEKKSSSFSLKDRAPKRGKREAFPENPKTLLTKLTLYGEALEEIIKKLIDRLTC
jgi:hypothetical protein